MTTFKEPKTLAELVELNTEIARSFCLILNELDVNYPLDRKFFTYERLEYIVGILSGSRAISFDEKSKKYRPNTEIINFITEIQYENR